MGKMPMLQRSRRVRSLLRPARLHSRNSVAFDFPFPIICAMRSFTNNAAAPFDQISTMMLFALIIWHPGHAVQPGEILPGAAPEKKADMARPMRARVALSIMGVQFNYSLKAWDCRS